MFHFLKICSSSSDCNYHCYTWSLPAQHSSICLPSAFRLQTSTVTHVPTCPRPLTCPPAPCSPTYLSSLFACPSALRLIACHIPPTFQSGLHSPTYLPSAFSLLATSMLSYLLALCLQPVSQHTRSPAIQSSVSACRPACSPICPAALCFSLSPIITAVTPSHYLFPFTLQYKTFSCPTVSV